MYKRKKDIYQMLNEELKKDNQEKMNANKQLDECLKNTRNKEEYFKKLIDKILKDLDNRLMHLKNDERDKKFSEKCKNEVK